MALTTFSDLVQEARERVKRDALAAGLPDDGKPLARRRHRRHRLRRCGGGVFGVCVDKAADGNSTSVHVESMATRDCTSSARSGVKHSR